MENCLIQLIVPQGVGDNISSWLENDIIDFWTVDLDDEHVQHNIVALRIMAEEVIDKLDDRYRQHDEYRLIMTRLGVSLPEAKPDNVESENITVRPLRPKSRTVSRQELVATLSSNTKLNSAYILMLLLSVVVAIVGLINNNIAVIIAAMVIAPLLGPNITLALATSMVDYELGWRAIKVGSSGALMVLVIAVFLGYLLPDSALNSTEILARTHISYGDIVLAVAAGAAGTLAFTTGGSGTLIGVMVAVALLPPLLVFGLKLGNGSIAQATGAGLLYAINFIGVNLGAVLTFVFQGIRPQGWWQADEAKKTSFAAIFVWAVLLIVLLLTIYWLNKQNLQVSF